MLTRKITPEILDHLSVDDPEAIRSRADLRRINQFMGNYSWILRQIPGDCRGISELGSGDGVLIQRLYQKFSQTPLHAYDLAPRPINFPDLVSWHQQDVLELADREIHGNTFIANLVLHHFQETELAKIGEWVRKFDTIIINEPLRWSPLIYLGKMATPLINRVTRHDMEVSIKAGFRQGELASLLGLKSDIFTISEHSTLRGSQRLIARRI